MTISFNNLGSAAFLQSDLERAEVLLEAALGLARELGDRTLFALALLNLGHAALERGDLERAGELLRESLLMSQELGDAQRILLVLVELACVAAAAGARDRAARLWGAVEGLSEATGLSMTGLAEPHQYERYRVASRAELGEAAWEEALAEGRAMNLEQAVSYALGEGTEGKG